MNNARKLFSAATLAMIAAPFILGMIPGSADAGAYTCIEPAKETWKKKASPLFVLVEGTFSEIVGPALPCEQVAATGDFASATLPCNLVDPFGLGLTGSLPGEYCGPIIPAGSAAVCAWRPVINTAYTELYVGFDPSLDGDIWFGTGEFWVYGPIPPSPPGILSTTVYTAVFNPYGSPARVIAYPTFPFFPGGSATDLNEIICS